METEIIFERTSREYGLKAVIIHQFGAKVEHPYGVRLQDTDCGEWIPSVKFFRDYAHALRYAIRCLT